MPNTGNTQIQINYGATANDGLGDPLRTAFIKTDENFDNIWLAGPVGSNITIGNNTIQVNNTNGNLVIQPNGTGIIQTKNTVQPWLNNINDLGAPNYRYRAAYIGIGGLDVTGNVTAGNLYTTGDFVVPGDVIIGGNLTVDGDTIQMGNIVTDTLTIQLANTAANGIQADGAGITVGANDNIATLLYDAGTGQWTTNIGLAVPVLVTGSIGSDDSSFINITDGVNVDGPVDAAGNVTAPYFIGDGSQLTGLPEQYGNANVAAYLPTYTGNLSAGNLAVSSAGDTWTISGQRITGPGGAYWLSNPAQSTDEFVSAPGEFLTFKAIDANLVPQGQFFLGNTYAEILVENGVNRRWRFEETGITEFPGCLIPLVAVGGCANIGSPASPWSNAYFSGTVFTGNIIPVANGVYSLGDSTHYWSNLWVANNTIYIGGVPLGVTGNVLTVDGQPVLSNDGDSDITTTGNLTVNAILTDGYFYANGQPFVSGGSIGNLEVTGTTIGIAPGAPETDITIGNSSAGLSVQPDTGNPIVKLYANTTDSSFFNSGGDYSTGTYVAGGAGGIITLNDATTIEQYLNNLSGPYTIVSVTVNGTDTVPWDGGGWGGGTVTINTTVPPTVDPTNVTSIVYNLVYENKFLLDVDDGSFGIYIGDNNFDIQSVRDVRIQAGDDFSVESNDIFDLRSRSTQPGDGVRIITDYSNTGQTWLFENNGNLTTPGDITVAGDITGTSGASTLYLKAQPDSNTYIQLNNTVNSTINTVADLEINTDVSNTARTWRFDTNGDLTAPNYIYFKDGTFIGDEGGAGTPVFRVDSPLGLGINLTTDSDISGNNYTWQFGIDGNLTLPSQGNIVGTTPNNSGSLQWVGNSSGDGYGFTTLVLRPDDTVSADQSIVIDPTAPNHIHIRAGGTQDNSGAQLYLGGEISHFSVGAGNAPPLYLKADNQQWTFGTDGVIYAPGNINAPGATFTGNVTADYFIGDGSQLTGLPASYGNANVATFLAAYGSNTISTTGNVTAGALISSGSIYGNVDLILGNIANASGTKTRITTFGANSYIQTGNGTVGSTGNIVFAPYLDSTEKVVINTATGNVTAANFEGNITITGNVTGTAANVELAAGSYEWTFDNTGNLTLPGNTFAVNYANGTQVNAVTRFEGSWTVPTGNSTQSFTVDANNTYYLWVVSNIPNGIITWNATATITNTNVPVVGAQYAWVYDGAGTPIDFTSIPNQFVGTANTIVRSSVSPSVTTNKFDFGINNASGSPQTVRYGWIKIS